VTASSHCAVRIFIVTAADLIRRLGLLILVAALIAAVVWTGAWRHLNLGELEAHRRDLLGLVHDQLALCLIGFVLAYVVVGATGLPGPLIMTLAGGILFGPWIGSLAVLAGATTGSMVLFLACRSAFGDLIRRRAGPRLAAVEAMISDRIFEHVLILRLLPVFPLGLISIGAGLIGAPLGAFAAATCLGMIPSTLIYTSIGSGLNRVLDQGGRLTPRILADPQILMPLAGLGLLACLPLAMRAWRGRTAKASKP